MSANDKFPPSSRYAGIEVATLHTSDGGTIAYLRRRFVPQPDRYALLREHVVVAGQRLDHIAAQYLGDAEQFWRIADANGAIAPETMTDEAGDVIRITLPADVPAMTEEQ
jgi:hypothetical protein